MGTADETLAHVDALVRTLYNQINEVLLGGRGSVWATPGSWDVHIWELWWEPTRERGPYLAVTLLRDSRGTPYLKVQGRRLPLGDARLERRLQRALRAAFLAPRAYTQAGTEPAGAQGLPRPTATGNGRASNESWGSEQTRAGAETSVPAEEILERTRRARGRARRNGRDVT